MDGTAEGLGCGMELLNIQQPFVLLGLY